jgi:hypothetical protein
MLGEGGFITIDKFLPSPELGREAGGEGDSDGTLFTPRAFTSNLPVIIPRQSRLP